MTGLCLRLAPADPEQLASQITGRLNGGRSNSAIDAMIKQVCVCEVGEGAREGKIDGD